MSFICMSRNRISQILTKTDWFSIFFFFKRTQKKSPKEIQFFFCVSLWIGPSCGSNNRNWYSCFFFSYKICFIFCFIARKQKKKNLFSAARQYKFNVTTIKSRKIRILETFSFGIFCWYTWKSPIFFFQKRWKEMNWKACYNDCYAARSQ